MAPRPTVIGSQGYRRGLASLSVVKELFFRVYRNALNASGRVWRDLPVRFARTCLPALPQIPGILLGVLVALRLVVEIPCGTSSHSSLPLITAAK